MRIPLKFTQGDSLTWKDDPTVDNLGNTVSSALWTLKYALRGPTQLSITSTADGSGWTTSMTAVQSAALTVGFYYFQAYAEKSLERYTLGNGRVEVLKNLALVATTYDGRTQSRIDLDAVQAAVRAMISGGAVQEYTIGNRSFRKMSLEDLIKIESRLKFLVAQEEAGESVKSGKGNPHNLFVRF